MNQYSEESKIYDMEMLNRSLYHKIKNEISLLKIIAYGYQRKTKNKFLAPIIEDLEKIPTKIREKRKKEEEKVKQIPHQDYDQIRKAISETAHSISDIVNNSLATIELKLRRIIRQKGNKEDFSYSQLQKLLTQLELTQIALNDLKSFNEGVEIRLQKFRVSQIFEKWQAEKQVGNATIRLDLKNQESSFNGDQEKIKGILNELVENSIKHNQEKTNLVIQIISQEQHLSALSKQKSLFITYSDNGKGVSSENQGSGLGLFLIRRTLEKMGGTIREIGDQGVKFEISIPYRSEVFNEWKQTDRKDLPAVS